MEVPEAVRFYQVGALLSPCYKLLASQSELPTYSHTNLQALLIVANFVSRIDLEKVEQAIDCVSQPARKKVKTISHLLLHKNNAIHTGDGNTENLTIKSVLVKEFECYMMISEIQTYEECSCPLEFWKCEDQHGRHNLLSVIAKFVFCIQ